MFEFIKSLFGKKAATSSNSVNVQKEYERIAEAKKAYREKKARIDAIIAEHNNSDMAARLKFNQEEEKRVAISNSTCPHCTSKAVHQEFKKLEGGFHGKSSGDIYGGGNFFGSSMYGHSSGRIDGKLDTYRINKCEDCGHEWEIAEVRNGNKHWYSGKVDYQGDLSRLAYRISDVLDVEYDPKDITEEYDSYEEKRAAMIEKLKKYSGDIINLPIEIIWYYVVTYSYELSSSRLEKLRKSRAKYDPYIVDFKNNVLKVLEDAGVKHLDDEQNL